MTKCQVDKMTNDKVSRQNGDISSWKNGTLVKCHVDKMAIYQAEKMKKWQIG
jgi:hypothetical protein